MCNYRTEGGSGSKQGFVDCFLQKCRYDRKKNSSFNTRFYLKNRRWNKNEDQ